MGFIHGLAMVLIVFEGIIIHCKSSPSEDVNSIDWIHNAPIIDIKGDQQLLPDELIELVISKTDFETAKRSVRSGIVNATKNVMNEMLRDRIVVITPNDFDVDSDTNEFNGDGDLFLLLKTYRRLMSLFDQFGDQVKKIAFHYDETGNHVHRTQINQNIIKRYANNFEELRILVDSSDEGLWKEWSNGDNDIVFPKVKKFQFFGRSSRNKFDLNSIFPRLESFKLDGSVTDVNCLANITTLKELELNTLSIQEHQLDHIFANNKNMTRISLTVPERARTMYAIAKDLTKLETLEVKYPKENFWFRFNGMEKYELSSVTHLDILFYGIKDLVGDLSFDMPHLKKLSLNGWSIDDNRIIDFINHFKELKTVELLVNDYNFVKCIEKLKHIKEFVVKYFDNRQLHSLLNFFEHFDKNSQLQTLKFLKFHEIYYRIYEPTMNEINIRLANANKPTWTLSRGEQERTGQKYLMFKRDL